VCRTRRVKAPTKTNTRIRTDPRAVTSADIPDRPDVEAGRKYNDVTFIDFSASERWMFLLALVIVVAGLYVSGEFPM